MNSTFWRAQVAVLMLALIGISCAAEDSSLLLKGSVLDEAGKPVDGVGVDLYSSDDERGPARSILRLRDHVVSDAAGSFQLQLASTQTGLLLARKAGYGTTWKQFGPHPTEPQNLVLPTSTLLAGVVVDELDQPVGGAEVSVSVAFTELREPGGRYSYNYLPATVARECFNTHSDADGRFQIVGFPANSSANLMVRLPGKALRQEPQDMLGPDTMPFYAGQEDIRLSLEPSGTITGRITTSETTPLPPPPLLTLTPEGSGAFALAIDNPTLANPDGSFHIPNVAAGSYRLRADFGTNSPPDWVAESVALSVESGRTLAGVELTAMRGQLFEVTVINSENRQVLPGVHVLASHPNYSASAKSDLHGIARLRLPPGDYQLMAQKHPLVAAETPATIGPDQPTRIEIEMVGPQRITGSVRRPNGEPAEGLKVRLLGSFGPNINECTTDLEGRFQLEWMPSQFQGRDTIPCLLIRDPEHNLAVARDLDEEIVTLDLELEPALSILGRAESDGKPVIDVTASLIFWTGNSGMHLQDIATISTSPGQFEIQAIPAGRRYGLHISAPGYGQTYLSQIDSDDPKRLELDPVELKPAILQLAGQVLDADDKPVRGARVQIYGEGQPSVHSQTDRDGRFNFAQICEGPAQLFASARNTHASVSAEGGDTNIVLRLGDTSSGMAATTIRRRVQGLVTDPNNQPVAGVQVAVFPHQTSLGKTDANGKFDLKFQLESWQVQSGGDPCLVVRLLDRNLAATEFLTEESTNITIQLQPALTFTGRVEQINGDPLPQAEVGVWLLAGRTYTQLNSQLEKTDANGVFSLKTIPRGVPCIVFATAKGFGRQQQQVDSDSDSNHLEVPTFTLKAADQIVAGQVFDDRERPVSGAHVSLSGDDQPNNSTTTDRAGRFRLMACEGPVRLFVNRDHLFANITAEPGDTNVIVNLSRGGHLGLGSPTRAGLRGKALPDLATVGLVPETVPAGRRLVVCLFDADQRPSRRAVRLLADRYEMLTARNIAVVAVQSVATADDSFQEWQRDAALPFPVGRVVEMSAQTRWATGVQSLPWIILTDAAGTVTLDGCSLDELDANLDKLRQ